MDILLLTFRIALAGVFAVAGTAKLADQQGSRKAMSDFGVPPALAGPIGTALPILELLIAVSLLFVDVSWYGALAAVNLLALFMLGMAVQIVKGNAPDCHCFGQLHSEPVSYKSLIRNGVFLLPAAVLLVSGPRGQGLGISNLNVEVIQLFAIVAGVALMGASVFFLRRISEQQTQIMRRIELLELISRDGEPVERQDAGVPHEGLPIGAFFPEFDLRDLSGSRHTRTDLVASGRPSMFFFVSPTCSPCQALGARFDEWGQELGDRVNLVFVSSGTPEANADKFESQSGRTILLQNERELADVVHAKWTPTALFVDASGRVASHAATGDAAIIDLMGRLLTSDLSQPDLHFAIAGPNRVQSKAQIGSEVPDFSIEAVNGENVSSVDLKGRKTLLVFWSPTCPHCVKMIDEVKSWDLDKRPNDPSLIVFSDGEVAAHRAIGLRSPIVIDKAHELSQSLGMYGTPSAVLINEDGKFASEVAVGAPNIRALIGRNGTHKV